jgi:hypothetical protein
MSNDKKSLDPNVVIVAIIGFVGTIIAALIGVFGSRTPTPTPTEPPAIVVTNTTMPTDVPTDTVPPGEPTSTPAPATDTPAPTFTFTPIPPVAIGSDWADGCISSLWISYSSKGPTDAFEDNNGCLLQPVSGFFANNGKLSFLYENRLSSAEVNGIFAPLPYSSGSVTVYVSLKSLDTSDIWMGVFSEPTIDSTGLLLTIPASNDVSSRPFGEFIMPGLEKITTTAVVNQGNGYGVKFEFSPGSIKAIVLPNVTATNQIPVSAAQKYIFIGYQAKNGTNRIDASFFDLVVTEQ